LSKNLKTVGRHKTTIFKDKERNMTGVKLYNSIVLRFDDDVIELNTEGFFTLLTRTRMNQASNQFKLGYWIEEDENGEWFARYKGKKVLFDGESLTLQRT